MGSDFDFNAWSTEQGTARKKRPAPAPEPPAEDPLALVVAGRAIEQSRSPRAPRRQPPPPPVDEDADLEPRPIFCPPALPIVEMPEPDPEPPPKKKKRPPRKRAKRPGTVGRPSKEQKQIEAKAEERKRRREERKREQAQDDLNEEQLEEGEYPDDAMYHVLFDPPRGVQGELPAVWNRENEYRKRKVIAERGALNGE